MEREETLKRPSQINKRTPRTAPAVKKPRTRGPAKDRARKTPLIIRRHPDLIFRLVEIMDERNLTYGDVAKMTGIPPTTLNDMGRGIIGLPGSEHLVRICRAFKLTPGDLLKLTVKK